MENFPHLASLLDKLNPAQREAVITTEGPLLVLAGAGTGKTRVITFRVAYLLAKAVPGRAILAVTFTNKAAGVMKDRIGDLLRAAHLDAADVTVSTFHSFCARLLRREATHLGLPRDFAIYDDDDQTAAVKRALAQLNLPTEGYPPRSLRSQISHAKNHGISPSEMRADASEAHDDFRKKCAEVYGAYNELLHKAGALDFDDLLLRAVDLLREHPQVRQAWSSRFQYIMVDEFQDTNKFQEELVRLLASTHRNICVVGDEDQSIYGWRGARAGNLKRFTEDFPDAKLIRLEENYRSTQIILDAAAAVVKNNSDRLGKTLQATLGSGSNLRFYEAPDASAEADYVGSQIAAWLRDDSDAHVAVLYRTGSQSRSFEEVLRRLGIKYRLVGGFSFYERAEVRAALAYVRLLTHPEDDVALLRVINVPPRGIGATTIGLLETRARETGQSLWAVIRDGEYSAGKKSSTALRGFQQLIELLQEQCRDLPPAQLIERILDQTRYLDWVEQQDNIEHTSRADNLRELANAMAEATEQGQTMEDILDRAALVADTDEIDENVPVSLMTLHSAKGLEFEAVFLAGLEEGLLPHSRSLSDNASVEEERRLFYVGMTRAKTSLMLSRAIYRRTYGEDRLRASLPSRFIAEIPGEFIQAAPGSYSEPGESRRYEPDPEFSDSSGYRRRGPSYGYPAPAYSRPPSSYKPASSAPTAARGNKKSGNPLIGTRVRHSKYGIGTIIEVDGDGEDRRLTVSFQDHGPKKLIERYANLQLA